MARMKSEARRLGELMPENATTDELMYEYYVKKRIEQSLKEAVEGDVISHNEVKQNLFLK